MADGLAGNASVGGLFARAWECLPRRAQPPFRGRSFRARVEVSDDDYDTASAETSAGLSARAWECRSIDRLAWRWGWSFRAREGVSDVKCRLI